jgi:hypothetical protein
METANWRNYRGHLIIARKTFLGLQRYDVWRRGQLVDTFRDGVAAEMHIDSLDEARI